MTSHKHPTLSLRRVLIVFIVVAAFFSFASSARAATISLSPNYIRLNSGLVGYWKFDENAGTMANDSSGKGNRGTLSGTIKPTWVAGKHAP